MRAYSDSCHYPKSTCICNSITTFASPVRIFILQHKREASHAKNTARLIRLCIPDKAHIINVSDDEAMARLQETLDIESTAILYPSERSEILEMKAAKLRSELTTLILIDGSWKQAYGIMSSHTWLANIPAYKFDQAPLSDYRIRHTQVANSLSTLEATAYALNILYGCSTQPLLSAQAAMQQYWQAPSSHHRFHRD